MSLQHEFRAFPKVARLYREIFITEKIDGTNAQVSISEDGVIQAGSRSRWITPEDDNFGFAAWVEQNKEELLKLGPGRHFGEWWGKGIQRGYGLQERRFSLFNVSRWTKDTLPSCCHLVPTLYQGKFDTSIVEKNIVHLAEYGSVAAPGYMNPEGIMTFHTASNQVFKTTILHDESPKSLVKEV